MFALHVLCTVYALKKLSGLNERQTFTPKKSGHAIILALLRSTAWKQRNAARWMSMVSRLATTYKR